MRTRSMVFILAAAASLTLGARAQEPGVDSPHWPGFRGWHARGVSEGPATPIEWDVPGGRNVLWRSPVPGLGHSSPVLWEDRVFVTTAVRLGGDASLKVGLYGAGEPVEDEGPHEFRVQCLDANTGALLWDRVAHTGTPRIKRHPKASHASSTPACNAERVVAFFGSEGLFCYDHEGELVWSKDLGVLDTGAPGQRDLQWGFASSPVIHEDKVIVQCDVQDQSFLAVLRLADGEEVWRTERDEDPTWCTPTVDVRDARAQVICNGYKHVGGYDLDSGAELWKLVGGGDVPVPTPVVAHDLIFLTSAHGRLAPIHAIDVLAEGELTMDADKCDALVWSHSRRGIYMQTPLVRGGHLYLCSDAGILACYEAGWGELVYRERLGAGDSGFSGSAVAAGDALYFTSEDGEVHVVRAGPEFEVLAVNDLGETCMSTPAVSEGRMYYRTRGHVVALARSPGEDGPDRD